MKRLIISIIFAGILATSANLFAAENQPVRYRDMAVDNESVWLATNNGLVRFDKATASFETVSSETYTDLTAVAVSPEGLVTVGGGQCGVATLNDGLFQPVKMDSKNIRNITTLTYENRLWIGAIHHIFHLQNDNWSMLTSPEPLAAFYSFSSFAFDQETESMWFGVSSSTLGNKIGYVDNAGKLNFLEDFTTNVNDIYMSPAGTLYIASDLGMFTCEDGKISFFEHPISAMPSKCFAVTGNAETIWFAAGTTLVRADGNKYQSFTCKPSDDPRDYITKLIPDGDTLWVLTSYGGLVQFHDDMFSEPTAVTTITEDRPVNGSIYDLYGRCIATPQKGQIYIKDGRKYVGR